MTKRHKIQSTEYRGRQCDQKEMQNGPSDINDYKEMQTSEKETQNNHEETQNDYTDVQNYCKKTIKSHKETTKRANMTT